MDLFWWMWEFFSLFRFYFLSFIIMEFIYFLFFVIYMFWKYFFLSWFFGWIEFFYFFWLNLLWIWMVYVWVLVVTNCCVSWFLKNSIWGIVKISEDCWRFKIFKYHIYMDLWSSNIYWIYQTFDQFKNHITNSSWLHSSLCREK